MSTKFNFYDMIKNIIGKKGMSLLWVYVENVLSSIADAVWDALWAVIFDGIAEAERKWDEGNWAKEKKQFVIDEVIKFVENHEKLGWVKKQAVKMFVSIVIDKVIVELNDEIGQDWVKQAKKVENNLDDYFPWIDEDENK